MATKTRLCLGCGLNPDPAYLNVDIRPSEGVDIVCDIRTVKFPPESFTEIFAKDVIEHVSFIEAKRLLRNCYSWLRPKGAITIHVQDMRFCAELLSGSGREVCEDIIFTALKWIYGTAGEGDTDYLHGWHRWGYTKESLCKLLCGLGFKILNTMVTCNGFGLLVVACKEP